jgi:hypothetical protein
MKQRLISDARRRAKSISRANGSSYQSCLDEVAASTGHDGWASFVNEPRALPEAPIGTNADETGTAAEGQGPQPHDASAEPKPSIWNEPIDWNRVVDHNLGQSLKGMVIWFVVIASVLAIGTTRIVTIPVLQEMTDAGISVLMMSITAIMTLAAFMMIGNTVVSAASAVIMTIMAHQRRPRLRLGTWARIWSNVALRGAFTAAVFFGAVNYGPTIMMHVGTEDVLSTGRDAENEKRIHVIQMRRDLILGPVRRMGDKAAVGFVVIDQRLMPKQFRLHRRSEDPNRMALQEALLRHPVLRMTGILDCRNGSYRVRRLEAADTVKTPAAFVLHHKARRTVTIDPVDLPTICGAVSSDAKRDQKA